MKVIISIGGSLAFKEEPDLVYMKKISSLIQSLDAEFGFTVGGGKICREYVNLARELKESDEDLHMLGIEITHANARLFKAMFPRSRFFDTVDEAAVYMQQGRGTPVLGGTVPGQTTDAVSAHLAEKVGADRWINFSNVQGIYDKDPNKFKDAKLIPEMTHSKLIDLIGGARSPSQNVIIDAVAAEILARANTDAHFIDGTDFDDAKNAILGKPHKGTVVKD